MPRLKNCKAPECDNRQPREQMHGPMKEFCSVDCGYALSRARVKARVEASHRKRQKSRREAIKSKSDWADEAQKAFNAWVRARDHFKPCLMCDKPNDGSHQRHACHFRSVKAAKQLRFNAYNAHAGCAQCNTFDSGNIVEYRIRLVKKIGQERVNDIECNNEICTHDIEYYKRVKRIFNKRTRLYKKLKGIA